MRGWKEEKRRADSRGGGVAGRKRRGMCGCIEVVQLKTPIHLIKGVLLEGQQGTRLEYKGHHEIIHINQCMRIKLLNKS